METAKETDFDAAFRRCLVIIKPYIGCITNTIYLHQYRIWLEKFATAKSFEKKIRNVYVEELCKQIQAGILKEPFTKSPPQGFLPPFEQLVDESKENICRERHPKKLVSYSKTYVAKSGRNHQNLKALECSRSDLRTQSLTDSKVYMKKSDRKRPVENVDSSLLSCGDEFNSAPQYHEEPVPAERCYKILIGKMAKLIRNMQKENTMMRSSIEYFQKQLEDGTISSCST